MRKTHAQGEHSLGALATDAARELHVLGEDRHALGVDAAEVRVLKQADEVGLARLLHAGDRVALEPAHPLLINLVQLQLTRTNKQ